MVHAEFGMIATMVEYKDRLAEAMRDASVTASGLAGELGLSYQAVKKVLDGKSASFTAQNHDLAATFLKVSSSWLANEIGPKTIGSQPDFVIRHSDRSVTVFEAKLSNPGAVAAQLAAALIDLPAGRRKAIAGLVAGLIEGGPTAEEANAIDALAPDVSISVADDWRHDAYELAKTHPDAVRIDEFLTLVDHFRAGKQAAERENSPKQSDSVRQSHRQ